MRTKACTLHFLLAKITAVFGGRPGIDFRCYRCYGCCCCFIQGYSMHGIEYLFPTVILCGLLANCLLDLADSRTNSFAWFLDPVMLGFVNGLAIVIGLAQLNSFQQLFRTENWADVQGTQSLADAWTQWA